MLGYGYNKVVISVWRELCLMQKIKFITQCSLQILLRHCKFVTLGTLRMPGHTHQKKVALTCGKLWCLSTCIKSTGSPAFFLRYYTLKNTAIWLGESTLMHNFAKIKSLQWNITNNITFHFRLFAEKTNNKSFLKIMKHLFYDHFAYFPQILFLCFVYSKHHCTKTN